MVKSSKAERKKSRRGAASFDMLATGLAEAGRAFYSRGWALGTSGNFSAVVERQPLHLVITASGVDKGSLTAGQFLQINHEGKPLGGRGKPSAEALLHISIARARRAGAVLHTHSVWSTLLSQTFAAEGGIELTGYEMLKGLEGVSTHQHREWLPILENSQDMRQLGDRVEAALDRHPSSHGFLLRGHGLYTWGRDLAEARRHVEILEFLLEVLGRTHTADARPFERRRRGRPDLEAARPWPR